MKVERVIPCVCLDHQLTLADSMYERMPHLKVEHSGKYFVAYCPKCGRGGGKGHESAYLALKDWNRFQYSLWQCQKKENINWMNTSYEIEWVGAGNAAQKNSRL